MSKKTKKWMVSVIACVLAMGSTTVQADELYLEARTGAVNVDESQLALLTDAQASYGGGGALGYELDLAESGPGVVDAVRVLGIYGYDTVGGPQFNEDVLSGWTRHRGMAAADVGFDSPIDVVRPLVRVGAGYSNQSLALDADGSEYADRAHGWTAEASGGLEATIVTADGDGGGLMDNLSIGATLMVGYSLQSEASFDDMRPVAEGDDSYQRAGYDAGTFDASGITSSLGLTVHYRLGR